MGQKYKVPTQNVEIRQCYMQHGHGGVSIGSEMAGGVKIFMQVTVYLNILTEAYGLKRGEEEERMQL